MKIFVEISQCLVDIFVALTDESLDMPVKPRESSIQELAKDVQTVSRSFSSQRSDGSKSFLESLPIGILRFIDFIVIAITVYAPNSIGSAQVALESGCYKSELKFFSWISPVGMY